MLTSFLLSPNHSLSFVFPEGVGHPTLMKENYAICVGCGLLSATCAACFASAAAASAAFFASTATRVEAHDSSADSADA